jgi:hypothetical protein
MILPSARKHISKINVDSANCVSRSQGSKATSHSPRRSPKTLSMWLNLCQNCHRPISFNLSRRWTPSLSESIFSRPPAVVLWSASYPSHSCSTKIIDPSANNSSRPRPQATTRPIGCSHSFNRIIWSGPCKMISLILVSRTQTLRAIGRLAKTQSTECQRTWMDWDML